MIIKRKILGPVATNAYLLIDDKTGEAALIDCPCDTAELDSFIADPAVKKLKYVLLTHGHYDHILGLPLIRRNTEAKIMIHEEDVSCLYNEKRSMAVFAGCKQTYVQTDQAFHDRDVIMLGSLKIKVIHTPGHTMGSCCFLVKNTIFSGDTLFYGTIGATHFPGGDEETLIRSLKKLDALNGDYHVFPGHDQSTMLSEERANNIYFRM